MASISVTALRNNIYSVVEVYSCNFLRFSSKENSSHFNCCTKFVLQFFVVGGVSYE